MNPIYNSHLLYIYGRVLFSGHEAILPINMEISTIHTVISVIKSHVNEQDVLQLVYLLAVQYTLS